jgi:hypothetical protein
MNAMEYNNRERLKRIEDAPSSEMSIRDRMAVDILAAMVTATTGSYALMEEDLDAAIALAEKLIEKLNRNR